MENPKTKERNVNENWEKMKFSGNNHLNENENHLDFIDLEKSFLALVFLSLW